MAIGSSFTTNSIIQSGQKLKISSVDRIVSGGIGLPIRCSIARYNPDVDEDTRKHDAVCKAVKITVGLASGVFTRIFAEKFGCKLVDKGIIKDITNNVDKKAFRIGASNAVSILFTILTTIIWDYPLINIGLNLALDKIFPNKHLANKRKLQLKG